MTTAELRCGSLLIDGFTSVGDWEIDCQNALVDRLVPSEGLRVLEIGFGLGMASSAIQEKLPTLHIIVEANPLIACKVIGNAQRPSSSVVQMRWQVAAEMLRAEIFDAVLYDPDPDIPADLGWAAEDVFVWVAPAIELLSRLLRPGGRMGFIDFTRMICDSSQFTKLIKSERLQIERSSVAIAPPAGCKYARPPAADIVILSKSTALE